MLNASIRALTAISLCAFSCLAAAQELPQLDSEREIVCVEGDDDVTLRIQCDEQKKRCLVAEARLSGDPEGPRVIPRELTPCSTAERGTIERLKTAGYAMVPARHESPFGYKRDERGRLYQTHFDLRRRYFVGVADAGTANLLGDTARVAQSVHFEVGGTYEEYDGQFTRRNKFRFLEGRLHLAPVEASGLLFSYDRGRKSVRPTMWITTFIGEPRRFDLNLDIGPGIMVGRFWYGPVEGEPFAYIDITQGHLNWEMFQSANLEDFLALRVGVGLGVRIDGSRNAAELYLYPEVALEWAWLAGDRGLTQVRLTGAGRLAHEPNLNASWYEARGSLSIERILLAITDQPIALYLEPSVHYVDLPVDGLRKADARVVLGGRLSFFVPPREPDDMCPDEAEDYDGYQDNDGCYDPDNDGDGIDDLRDRCPLDPEDFDGDQDTDGCPEF